MPSLATFNANNFFLRYRFSRTYPGDMSRASQIEASEVASRGYLPGVPFGSYPRTRFIVWAPQRRDLAGIALAEPDDRLPDILCLQEVENIQSIRIFNERYLGGHYPYSLLIDAYDPRNIDVGVLSTLRITDVRSHIDERGQNGRQNFRSRDCLEVDIELPDDEVLTVFVNHFKSKFVRRRRSESEASYRGRVRDSHGKRLAQAAEVVRYVDRRFRGQQDSALYAVVGDFNDTPESPWVAPLMNTPRLTNIIGRHRPLNDRWTYYWRSRNRVSQIDYILTSRALTERINRIVEQDPSRRPYIERGGLAFREWSGSGETLPGEATLVHLETDVATAAGPGATPDSRVPFDFPRYTDVIDDWRNNISDHCPVKVWF
jgi:endonuclease/exonuclease/phosphatase family metal-dependent hydrolase